MMTYYYDKNIKRCQLKTPINSYTMNIQQHIDDYLCFYNNMNTRILNYYFIKHQYEVLK